MVKFYYAKKGHRGRGGGKRCATGRTVPIVHTTTQQQINAIRFTQPEMKFKDVQRLATKRRAVSNFIASAPGVPLMPFPDDEDLVDEKHAEAYRRDLDRQLDSSPGAKATILPMTTASAMLRGLDPDIVQYWQAHPHDKATFANKQRKRTHIITTRGLSAASWAGRLASSLTGVWKSDKVKDEDIFQSMCVNAHLNGGNDAGFRCKYLNQDGLTKETDFGTRAQKEHTILDVRVSSVESLDTLCFILSKRGQDQPKDQLTIGCFTLPPRFILGVKHPAERKDNADDLSYHKAFQEMSKTYGVGFHAVMTTKGVYNGRRQLMWCIIATPNATLDRLKKMAQGYAVWRAIQFAKKQSSRRPAQTRLTMYCYNKETDETVVKDYPG
jgi:hypothetical protein